MWLKNVAPHIENINGLISLQEGSNQIDINLSASVDDIPLKIETVRDITTTSGRKLENWYFSGLDLDFGILSLQTEGEGVELHIPGIMENENYGNIQLVGKSKQETFYFAGPVKHPLGYGLIILNNSEVTYPFISNSQPGDKPSVAVQFLSNMDWDVIVKPGEDVIYIKDIPAYLDNVRAEITVDQSSPGIEFSANRKPGIITRQAGISGSKFQGRLFCP